MLSAGGFGQEPIVSPKGSWTVVGFQFDDNPEISDIDLDGLWPAGNATICLLFCALHRCSLLLVGSAGRDG